MLLKQLIIILIAIAFSLASEKSNLSVEQQREVEFDDLIKTLEERMKANRASSVAETKVAAKSLDEHDRDLRGVEGQQQIMDIAVQEPIKRTAGEDDEEKDEGEEAKDERKSTQTISRARVPPKKAAGARPTTQRSSSSDFEKDEAYCKSLLRLQNLYRSRSKHQLDEAAAAEDRPSRHCAADDRAARKLDRDASTRASCPEKSRRRLAERLAEAAEYLAMKPGRAGSCLHSARACDRSSCAEPVVIAPAEPLLVAEVQPVLVVEDEAAASTRRDAKELAAREASEEASVVGAGSSGGSAAASSGISRQLQLKHAGLSRQIGSRDDYERKTIMDVAIDEAAGMSRKLAYEARAGMADGQSPDLERRILGLAIDLVNKLTLGAAGDKLDAFGDLRYSGVDDYLKASVGEAETEAEFESDHLSNAGFDYVSTGRRSHDAADALGDAHLARASVCDSCAERDTTLGGRCPLCKRSTANQPDKAQIYHLEQLPQVRSQKYKSAGVWEDLNKLYNFDDFENEKFIDLSLNCTRNPQNLNCQRFNFDLVVPKGADPVPLWFVRDNLNQGRALAADMHERADKLQRPKAHSASGLHHLGNRVPMIVRQLNKESQSLLLATNVLRERLRTEYKVKPSDFLEFVRHQGFRVSGSETCRPRQQMCNSLAKYRSLDGSCNNFAKPSWGRTNSALLRILPPRYSDEIHALPLSASGGQPLPNARQVSNQLFGRRTDAFEAQLTLAFAQWGQILAHDLGRQVSDQTADGGIECCASEGDQPLASIEQHHSCAPIVSGRRCMNFVRSMTVAREDCSIGAADQLNAVSSFLDLSPLYGADEATSARLRAYHGGLLSYEVRANRLMPPTSVRSGSCDNDGVCYQTGDARGNQDPQLAVILTLLFREHTRLAYELAAVNPHWDDETLFQESRRIVIAEYQHITYQYWLPLVLGKQYCKHHNICPASDNLSHAYSEKINPSTINGFSTGAFRFLHSLVEGNISLVTDNRSTSYSTQTLWLSDYYFRPAIVESDFNFEALLRGLVGQSVQKADSNFHPEISEHLFRSAGEFGMDLQALDIQRSRDHGIPGYNAYRRICGLATAQDFHGLINEISLSNIDRLRRVYKHVDDVDLLVGIGMENRMPGSVVGPTARCLIGEQFYRSRLGDKYFYDNANFPHSFTTGQFEEIKKASLALMICDLGQALSTIQRNPFQMPTDKNTLPCSNLSRINLELWREQIDT